MNALVLATAYLRFHWGRSLVLILVAALILAVPAVTRMLLDTAEARLTARAEATPLLLGRRGSALDLTMAALYFSDERPTPLPMAEVEAIWDSGFATPMPLHTEFESGGWRIVGTTLDYFDFRGLALAEGRSLAILGEAILGARVAEALALAPGDTLVSTPQNLFDLDGIYPLAMPVVGVFAPTGTPDDDAIFVDLRTAWVIAGIGHGHDDVVESDEPGASAGVVQFRQITESNLESFHFHGDAERYPVSAVLVAPYDTRGATILRGRYLDPDGTAQMIVPADVVQGLVDRIFRIRAVLDAVTLAIGAAAFAAIGLAIFLSWRLREREVATAVRIGARRGTILRLLMAETGLLLAGASLLATMLTMGAETAADTWVGWLLSLGL